MGGIPSLLLEDVGMRYIAICECNHPAISRLVLFLRTANGSHPFHNRERDPYTYKRIALFCRYWCFFPHQGPVNDLFYYSEIPWFSRVLAILNDVGFPRYNLYTLLQESAERYCTMTLDPVQPGDLGLLSQADRQAFVHLKKEACKKNRSGSRPGQTQPKPKKKHEARAKAYDPSRWLTPAHLQQWNVRFVEKEDVDWILYREVVVVPKDFETVQMFEKLEKQAMGLWNFARRVEDVKFTSEFWQNVLILG